MRWWIPAALWVLALGALVFVWVRDEPLRQNRYLGTGAVLFLAVLLSFVWAVTLSGWRRRTRRWVLGGSMLLVVLFFGLFEVRDVTGDLVPIFGWRWRAKDDALPREVVAPTQPDSERVRAERDWPQFQGPERDGVVREDRLERDWAAHPPRVVWRRELGPSWSSFAVAGELAVTQEQRGEDECVVAYDLGTGEPVWLHSEPARYDESIGGIGPRATPTVDRGRVYALGATGLLVALDLESGELLWKRDVPLDAGSGVNVWGAASSPLVLDELVVVTSGGGGGSSVLAYERDSGEPAWKAGDEQAGYASPSLHELAGVPQIVTLNQTSVTAHDPATGELLWQAPWSDATEAVSQPVAIPGDRLIVASGYGVGAGAFHVTRNEAGGLAIEQLWKSRALKSKLSNYVYHDGHVYGFDDGILACIDVERGRRAWKGGRYGHGQLLLFGDLLLVTAESGELVLIEANSEELRELGRAPALDSKTWNGPAFAPPYLLLRNDQEAVCVELALEAAPEASPDQDSARR